MPVISINHKLSGGLGRAKNKTRKIDKSAVHISREVNIKFHKFLPQTDVNTSNTIIVTGIAIIKDSQVFSMLGKIIPIKAKQSVATSQMILVDQMARESLRLPRLCVLVVFLSVQGLSKESTVKPNRSES